MALFGSGVIAPDQPGHFPPAEEACQCFHHFHVAIDAMVQILLSSQHQVGKADRYRSNA